MPVTYEPVATTTLGSATSTITFSSIPSTYTDLRIVMTGKINTSADIIGLRFNGDTATNYSWIYLDGNGVATSSAQGMTTNRIYCGYFYTTEPSLITADIFSYTGSTFKTALVANASDQNGTGGLTVVTGMWRSTSAITSITLYSAQTMVIGTTATVYGILKA